MPRFVRCMLIFLSMYLLIAAKSQAYPERPITIVVPFSTGGSADILARMVSEGLSTSLGKPVIVENRTGAGGTIAAAYVAKAPADGYTLLMGVTATQTVAPFIYKNLQYDPEKDFKPIIPVAQIPVVFVVNAGIKADTLKEFLLFAKSQPAPMSYASAGTGGTSHLTGELFQSETKVVFTHIPYKGASPAMVDLLSGRVDMIFDHLPTVLANIQNGKLKALGVAGVQRAKALPQVPTLKEAGVAGVEVNSWFGLLAPAGTPNAIVSKLHQEVQRYLMRPETQLRLASIGAEPMPMSSQEFSKQIEIDRKNWEKLMREINF